MIIYFDVVREFFHNKMFYVLKPPPVYVYTHTHTHTRMYIKS